MSADRGREESTERPLFREEALRRYTETREFGELLRLPPRWTRYAYPLVVGMALVGLLVLIFGKVSQYASGPAVVRVEGGQSVFSTVTGTVAAVEAEPGRPVAAGELLLRLHAEPEQAALARVRGELETLLADRLRDPSNEATRRALLPLKAELDLARARVEARRLRAPRAGVVQEIRVREGQSVREGDLVVSLVPERALYTLLALLPASFLPELAPGLPLRVEMAGYPQATVSVTIEHLGDQAIGPAEARRALGPVIADSIEVPGSVVLVTARLPGTTFHALDGEYGFHDGMVTLAEVPVRTERLIFALFPGLRSAFAS